MLPGHLRDGLTDGRFRTHHLGSGCEPDGGWQRSTRVLTTATVMETGMGHYDRAMAYGIIFLVLVTGMVSLLTWL